MDNLDDFIKKKTYEREGAKLLLDWVKHIATLESGFIIAALALFRNFDGLNNKWFVGAALGFFMVSIAAAMLIGLKLVFEGDVKADNELYKYMVTMLVGFSVGVLVVILFVFTNLS